MLKCYYWNPTNNFGDMLAPVILSHYSGQKVRHTSRTDTGKFLVVGSILRWLRQNDIVWGAGSMHDESLPIPESTISGVKFLAVRGPLTRGCFLRGGVKPEFIPEVYGDPALLMPEIYKPVKVGTRFKAGIILNEVDKPAFRINSLSGVKIININDDWRRIINLLNACDIVLSSSLHGIVVAEAYGIPAAWIKVTDKVRGNGFKFQDYFLSTGRERREPAIWRDDLKAALAAGALPKPVINAEPLKKSLRNYLNEVKS